ncbi:MAG: butyrate kinase [Lachnospiraceae bacterium]|nr:butyrate kinase [Lachnospiraceae bacterium]
MKNYKVFAINPGSTSTKIAMFEGEQCVFSENVSHDAEKLKEFKEISDQFEYRKETILAKLEEAGQTLQGTAAFAARGGGLVNVEGGVYKVEKTLLEHARVGYTVKHPATLGAQLADAFSKEFGGQPFVVNPPDVDEFSDVARVTGMKGVYRESRIHALNQKEIGIRYGKQVGKRYEDLNLIICHIGGGISVTAHDHGKMVDSNDIANGDGPMAPTRCGQLPVKDVITMCYSGKYTEKEMRDKTTKTGGLVDHLGTSDAREVGEMIRQGNGYAKLIYDSMIYEIGKTAGAMAAVLKGKADAIILTGGISHDNYVVEYLTDMLSFIAPVKVMAGEFEMEALAAGAIRVLEGAEDAKTYTGIPVWQGFQTQKE